MAIVVSDNRIITIIITIKALSIPMSLMTCHFIKLDNRVVTTPWPHTCCSFFFRQDVRAIPHQIIFYQDTITSYRNDTISRNLVYEAFAHYDMPIGKPFLTIAIGRPDYAITLTTPDNTIFNQQAIESRRNAFPTVMN